LRADTAAAISVLARLAIPWATRTRRRHRRPQPSRSRLPPPLPARSSPPREQHLLATATISRGGGGGRLQEQAMAGRRQARAGTLRRRAIALGSPALGADAAAMEIRSSAPLTATTGAHTFPHEVFRSRSCLKITTARGSAAALARGDTHAHAHAHAPGSEDAALWHRGSSHTRLAPQRARRPPLACSANCLFASCHVPTWHGPRSRTVYGIPVLLYRAPN
jgi:hypothetical protein